MQSLFISGITVPTGGTMVNVNQPTQECGDEKNETNYYRVSEAKNSHKTGQNT